VSLRLDPASVIAADRLWTLAVNRNQNLLGKTMLVANRGVDSVGALRPDEWADLHDQVTRVTTPLDDLFRPDHYNYAFLMNADIQVHLHVIPRYREVRSWHGETFSDQHFGTLFGTEVRLLNEDALASLAAAIRACMS